MRLRITRSVAPNLLTLANLFCGFSAIVSASENQIFQACMFILLGAFFDMFDGLVARMINAASEMGVELDSLSDAVSFGVAPSFILYQSYFKDTGELGIFFASLPALAGVLRLARFNVQLSSLEDKKYFTGLPIPSSAMTIVAYLMFYADKDILSESLETASMYFLVIAVPLLMVSNIKYPNMPRPSKATIKDKPFLILLLVALIILFAYFGGLVFFPFMIFYITFNAFRHLIFWLRKIRQPEDDIDDGGLDTDKTSPPFNF